VCVCVCECVCVPGTRARVCLPVRVCEATVLCITVRANVAANLLVWCMRGNRALYNRARECCCPFLCVVYAMRQCSV
jgi:hypothetical protein